MTFFRQRVESHEDSVSCQPAARLLLTQGYDERSVVGQQRQGWEEEKHELSITHHGLWPHTYLITVQQAQSSVTMGEKEEER